MTKLFLSLLLLSPLTASAAPSFHGVSTGYDYVGYWFPQLPRTADRVVHSSVYHNGNSYVAAVLFDAIDVPVQESFFPRMGNGQSYGGVEDARFVYSKQVKAGDFAVNCQISLSGEEPIGDRSFKEVYEKTFSFSCNTGYYALTKPDFTSVEHSFTDDESNPLIQAILKNGGSIKIDGSSTYWHQTYPEQFPATYIELSCVRNECKYTSQTLK
jgi:hypothetical protein